MGFKKQTHMPDISQYVMHILEKEHPETVEQLVRSVQKRFHVPQEKIIENILCLQKQGKLALTHSDQPSARKYYLFSRETAWFWVTTSLALISAVAAFVIDEIAFPLVYVRYVLGSLLVLYLPGYSLLKGLFSRKELDNLQRIVLSVGTSLTLVSITAFILNYTPWGITLSSVTFSLLVFTLAFALTAVIKERGLD